MKASPNCRLHHEWAKAKIESMPNYKPIKGEEFNPNKCGETYLEKMFRQMFK
jgi:hypothetical protein